MTIQEAIDAVRQISSDLVILPGSDKYDEITKSYYSELERELEPACFLTPSSASQIGEIVKAVKPLVGSSALAICGTGQQTTPGVANVRGGLTLHLRNLRGIDIDAEKSIISVAAGELMKSVYEKATSAGLGLTGNRHAIGGMGGEALQGGLSYFSYARGLACDAVINFEVVLASGEVVNANAETNKDLWIALKGGGNNFGVVTRFDVECFPQSPQLWGGKVFYFQPSFPGQIQSLVDYLKHPGPDLDVHICLSLGYAASLGDHICMNDIFCTRPEKPAVLEPFADVQPQVDQMKTLRVAHIAELSNEAFSGALANRVVKMSTTVKADTKILKFTVDVYRSAFEQLKDVKNLLFSITYESLPASMMEQAASRGGNSLGLDPSDGSLVVILLYTSWDDSSSDDKVFEVNKAALEKIDKEAKDQNQSSPYRWLHYGFHHQDVMSSYGVKSLQHLRAVSSKYDPDGFFQTSVVGPFKLWR